MVEPLDNIFCDIDVLIKKIEKYIAHYDFVSKRQKIIYGVTFFTFLAILYFSTKSNAMVVTELEKKIEHFENQLHKDEKFEKILDSIILKHDVTNSDLKNENIELKKKLDKIKSENYVVNHDLNNLNNELKDELDEIKHKCNIAGEKMALEKSVMENLFNKLSLEHDNIFDELNELKKQKFEHETIVNKMKIEHSAIVEKIKNEKNEELKKMKFEYGAFIDELKREKNEELRKVKIEKKNNDNVKGEFNIIISAVTIFVQKILGVVLFVVNMMLSIVYFFIKFIGEIISFNSGEKKLETISVNVYDNVCGFLFTMIVIATIGLHNHHQNVHNQSGQNTHVPWRSHKRE
jgi:DNA repair exonuclease SbcCD ATPase subunit